MQQAGIAAYRWKPRWYFDVESYLLTAGLHKRGFCAALNELHHTDRCEFQFELSCFDSRELQEIVRQSRQPIGVIAHDFKESPVVLWIFERAAQQGFRKPWNRCERSLESVRGVGHEVWPDAFEPPQLRDIVKHNDRARRFLCG